MDQVKLHASLPPKILSQKLLKGSLLALTPSLLLIGVGIIYPNTFLQDYGLLTFSIFLLSVTYGMIPYRKLLLKQMQHEEFLLTPEGFSYFSSKKKVFEASWKSLEAVRYYESSDEFGVELEFGLGLSRQELNIFEPLHKIGQKENCFRFPHFKKSDVKEIDEVWKSHTLCLNTSL